MSVIPERWGPVMKKRPAKTVSLGTGKVQRPPTKGRIGPGTPVKGAKSAYKKGGRLRR
jgi:hypothetical protein